MFRPLIGEKTHSDFRKKAHDTVIQAMIEVDVKEWDDFLLT